MRITLRELKAKGACDKQLDLFGALYGASVEVTLEGCLAVAGWFDWNWAANELLSAPGQAEYDKARAVAQAGFARVYAANCARPGSEFDKILVPARAEYNKACAAAFCNAFSLDRASVKE